MAKKAYTLLQGKDRELAELLAKNPDVLWNAAKEVDSDTIRRLESTHSLIRRLTPQDLSVRVNVTTVSPIPAAAPAPSERVKK